MNMNQNPATAPAEAPNTEQELDSFVAAFTAGIDSEAPTTETVESTPAEPPTSTEDGKTDGKQPQSPENPEDDKTKNPEPKEPEETSEQKAEKLRNTFEKSDKAFAELRVKNKEYDKAVVQIAKLAGIPMENPTEALKWLTTELTRIQSQGGKINDATLKEIGKAQEIVTEQAKAEIASAARTGFDTLAKTHGLDDKALLAFAAQLEAKGINPFSQKDVDVIGQYRLMNYDNLIAQAVERGKQEEIARRTKAQTHSTTPQPKVGGATATGESLNTVDALSKFLNQK